MKRFCMCVIMCILLASVVRNAHGLDLEYSKAVKFAKEGKSDFAFMFYSKLLRNNPSSKFRDQALFASGEYYFRNSGFKQASEAFQKVADEYPDSDGRLYALAYLLNIAYIDDDQKLIDELEKQIIDLQQVSFVFREKKEISYKSPMNFNYLTIIHIDKIEFYVEGELFAKVSF